MQVIHNCSRSLVKATQVLFSSCQQYCESGIETACARAPSAQGRGRSHQLDWDGTEISAAEEGNDHFFVLGSCSPVQLEETDQLLAEAKTLSTGPGTERPGRFLRPLLVGGWLWTQNGWGDHVMSAVGLRKERALSVKFVDRQLGRFTHALISASPTRP